MSRLHLTGVTLPPDSYAVVMATGIVSIAAAEHGYSVFSDALAVVAATVFLLLTIVLFLRVIAGPGGAFGDLADPDVTLRWFASVAACAVLAARFDTHLGVVCSLGATALIVWLLLLRAAAGALAPLSWARLRDDSRGAWLLPSVATAGLAITTSALAVRTSTPSLLAVSALAWLAGLGIYLAVTTLVVGRAIHTHFDPRQITPDSWILMGALAIATLAGDRLLAASITLGAPSMVTTAVRALTFMIWIIATGWIPVICLGQLWRIKCRLISFTFAGVWWAAVFPLGMYATATAGATHVFHLPMLMNLSRAFCWIASTAWLLVAGGAACSLARSTADRR